MQYQETWRADKRAFCASRKAARALSRSLCDASATNQMTSNALSAADSSTSAAVWALANHYFSKSSSPGGPLLTKNKEVVAVTEATWTSFKQDCKKKKLPGMRSVASKWGASKFQDAFARDNGDVPQRVTQHKQCGPVCRTEVHRRAAYDAVVARIGALVKHWGGPSEAQKLSIVLCFQVVRCEAALDTSESKIINLKFALCCDSFGNGIDGVQTSSEAFIVLEAVEEEIPHPYDGLRLRFGREPFVDCKSREPGHSHSQRYIQDVTDGCLNHASLGSNCNGHTAQACLGATIYEPGSLVASAQPQVTVCGIVPGWQVTPSPGHGVVPRWVPGWQDRKSHPLSPRSWCEWCAP